MWMQNSAASGNFHDRNRFGSQYGHSSYNGGSAHDVGAGDWKSKILESGQWLGGKVIEYGGKLARGPNTDSLPDHFAQQMPRNDGRANWMADIRSNTSSYSRGGTGGYNASGGGYQNDFATERPNAYSDYGQGYSSNPLGGYEPKSLSSTNHHESRHVKKKKKEESKKSKKKSTKKKKKKKSQSESDSESPSESEELSVSASSESESPDERRHKSKSKKKAKAKKSSGFYSESESDDEVAGQISSVEYAFSFDPAKLPPPPVEEKRETISKVKGKKSKKNKNGKKSRRRAVASSSDESTREKTQVKAKKRSGKKDTAVSASVDLLGVDLDAHSATATQEVQPSIFDASPSQNPLQDLAGLSFSASASVPAHTQPSVLVSAATVSPTSSQQMKTFGSNLLPENNIVDLSDLASEKKKTLSAHPKDNRTLNDLQKACNVDQPVPVMATSMQQLQQQNLAHGMMNLNMSMNQLQLSNTGSIQMYPIMQSQMMNMAPQMIRSVQPQMINMHQVAQDGGQHSLHGHSTGVNNSGSSSQVS